MPKVIDWLVNSAPEYWRWAYEWVMRAEAGDPTALRDGPNQEWVIEAFATGRPIDRILDILQRAAWIALDEGNLPRVIELGTLAQYVENGPRFQTDEFERLLFCQLALREDPTLERRILADLPMLSDDALPVVAETWARDGDTTIPQACFEQFRSRLIDAQESGVWRDRRLKVDVARYLHLMASIGTISAARVLDFIRANKKQDNGHDAFGFYCERLASLQRGDALREFFAQPLEKGELYDLGISCVRLACEEGIDLGLWTRDTGTLSLPMIVCYRWLRGNALPSPLCIERPDLQLLMQKDYSLIGARPDLIRFFHSLFFSSLALALATGRESIDAWLAQLPGDVWVENFCRFLIEGAADLSVQLKSGQLPSYGWIYQKASTLQPPDAEWRENDVRFYGHATGTLVEIALDLHLLARLRGGRGHITRDDLDYTMRSQHWNRERWLDRYVEGRRPLMTDEALSWFLDSELTRLAGLINQLSERYSNYAHLAQIAIIHGSGFTNTAKTLLRSAAACVVGYGYHKDYRLFEAIESVEAYHKADAGEAREWLFALAPMIAAVLDFTDGDETGALVANLAGAILIVCPELFPAYYEYLLNNEDWRNAEASMEFFIKQADLNDPISLAIACTAVDSDDLRALRDRAMGGDASALAAFEAQERFLGGIRFQERDSTGGSMVEPREPPVPPSPEDYPPEKFKDYLDVLQEQGIGYRHELVTTWFDHWTPAGHGPDVLDAVEALMGQERLSARIDHLFDRVFELCRTLRGRSMAFPWLVRAHRERNGWHSFYAPKDEARKRFEVVGREYRNRWLEFVQETAVSRYARGRQGHAPVIGLSTLVEFCLAVGQKEVAFAVAEAIVKTTLERRADLNLPLPAWVPSA